MEATDLLNKQDKKKNGKVNTKNYFNDLDRTAITINRNDEYPSFESPLLRKTVSSNQQARKMRTTSYASYANPMKSAYMYYDYAL